MVLLSIGLWSVITIGSQIIGSLLKEPIIKEQGNLSVAELASVCATVPGDLLSFKPLFYH
jgi:hypothetical protein